MLKIDGFHGEGGGQILRSALSLSVATGQPFTIEKIRAKREKPGLLRQHLTAVRAAAAISSATVSHAEIGSTRLTFTPGAVRGGEYAFNIGSAGSATLVLQTILPPLALADVASHIIVRGGTHNCGAPTYEFLERAFLPLLRRIGYDVDLALNRPGFYPAGGGEIEVFIRPSRVRLPLDLTKRGNFAAFGGEAVVANLPFHIAEREVAHARRLLERCHGGGDFRATACKPAHGKGNSFVMTVEYEAVTEVFSAIGRLGISSERVAAEAVGAAKEFHMRGCAVAEHLADQLLLPLALGAGGVFTTQKPSLHFTTNCQIIRRFLDVSLMVEPLSAHVWQVMAVV